MAPARSVFHIGIYCRGDLLSGSARVKLHPHSGAANLYIPREIVGDTSFPFKKEDWKDLVMEISGSYLIVRRRREGER